MAAESVIETKHRLEEKSLGDFYSRIELIVAGGTLPRRAPATSALGMQMKKLGDDFNSTLLKDAARLLNILRALPILPRTDAGIIGIKNTGLGKNKFKGTLLITLLYKNNNKSFVLKMTHYLLAAILTQKEEKITLPNAGQDTALIITDSAGKETTFSITDINHALSRRALEHAINEGDFDLVTQLAPNVDLNVHLSDGEFPLYKAYKANPQMLTVLLENGAKMGAEDIWYNIYLEEELSKGVVYPFVQKTLLAYSLRPAKELRVSHVETMSPAECLIKLSGWRADGPREDGSSDESSEEITQKTYSGSSSPASE